MSRTETAPMASSLLTSPRAMELMAGLMDEASEILAKIPAEVSDAMQIRFPLADELVGSAAMLRDEVKRIRATLASPTVSYLTNACGELTEHGTLTPSEDDFKKIPFEDGPGYVLPYLAEISGEKYVLGNLEVAYQDPAWDDADIEPKEQVRQYCEAALSYIQPRLAEGSILLPLDDEGTRFIIGVALPLDQCSDSSATRNALALAFGSVADMMDQSEWDKDCTAQNLADGFINTLKSWLTTEELQLVVTRNQAQDDPGICHSHDFCDANMAMAEGFTRHCLDPMSTRGMALWNEAWDIAKQRNFDVDPPAETHRASSPKP